MELTVWIILFTIYTIVNWIVSLIVYKKIEGKLLGKNWIIGVVGLIGFISISWLLALFINYYILIFIMITFIPWWLNYMFYLVKQNRTKERKVLYEK